MWKVYCGDNVTVMRENIPDESIDLTVTSPPYDNLRDYRGFEWDFENLAHELYRVTKPGGVVVWVVGDVTKNGTEKLIPFRQAIYFKDTIGFRVHDTMIYKKHSPFPPNVRYWDCFEFMFVLSKGKPKVVNLLQQPKKGWINDSMQSFRKRDGITQKANKKAHKRRLDANNKKTRIRDNIWDIDAGYMRSTTDEVAYQHPAIFPEQLAHDHIISWSNPGDTVLDPFAGSGTTLKMAEVLQRNSIGIEISEEYCEIIKERMRNVEPANEQVPLF
jgi:DNA modification methylase